MVPLRVGLRVRIEAATTRARCRFRRRNSSNLDGRSRAHVAVSVAAFVISKPTTVLAMASFECWLRCPFRNEKPCAKGAHSWMQGAFSLAVFFITMLAGGPACDVGFGALWIRKDAIEMGS